ncbi:hypothetical protein [Actinoplanes derwentensis]|uniref:Glycerophosphoryl diester phosphodiesterase family protein n=1 Tax=Actinoplanes derwentensis TaxID=113562 RepID=A0A1H1UD07_9ACTN|nr:hypothetical protein [Actinoplanes derwentensis]GID85265.1 hypothetical protein Ade03nite_41890 [Actinoplanes derwentensis]SDS70096.1 hypothetical protein SAMN04489716_1397 [Actinoplanes derwentensis]
MKQAWWSQVDEAAQLLASRLNALVAVAARNGVYRPPPGTPAPRRRRQPASLRHLAEVIRTNRLAPGMSVDKDDVAAVLAGDPQSVTDPVLVLAVARAAHLIAEVPLEDADADRFAVAAAHVSALIDAARQADERAPDLVPVPLLPVEPVVIDAYFTTRRPGRHRALIAAVLGVLVLAGFAAFRSVGQREPPPEVTAPAPAAVGTVTPLAHADSRDDYLHPRPVLDALDHGFTGLDVDVVLHDGSLLLCHHVDGDVCEDPRGNRIAAKPFDETYLRGLESRVNTHGGRVYPGFHQQVLLFVEITCVTDASGCALPADRAEAATDPNNPLVVARTIMDALVPYRGMLFHVEETARFWGPVQVVITGDHNNDRLPAGVDGDDSVRGLLARQAGTYAFLDGTFALDRDQHNADLVPVISFPNPATDQNCTGAGEKPIQLKHWDDVFKAQTTGHHVRVWDPWDCVDRTHFWTDALYGGVDYLSSSHLAPLGEWLTTNAAGGGGGACAVPEWIETERLNGQYCTLITGEVPVMSRPDPNSAPAGSLARGGSIWFLGQQPGESHKNASQHNFWWAYTRADNGQWGWVSLIHFTDGLLDQSAEGLQYSCYDIRPGESADCHPL